jgi:hypothetical protein
MLAQYGVDAAVAAAANVPLPDNEERQPQPAAPGGADVHAAPVVALAQQTGLEIRVAALAASLESTKADAAVAIKQQRQQFHELHSTLKAFMSQSASASGGTGKTSLSAVQDYEKARESYVLTSSQAPEDASGSRRPAASPAGGSLLPGLWGSASLNKGNAKSLLPDLDAHTRALLASDAVASASGGRTEVPGREQQTCLLPGHVAHQRGKRINAESSEVVAVQDPVSGALSFRPSASFPGGGKPLSDAVLLERMPTFNLYLAANDKVKRILTDGGFMTPLQAEGYEGYVKEMRELSDQFLSNKEDWCTFLVLDQDLRLHQFDNDLEWTTAGCQIKTSFVQKALIKVWASQQHNTVKAAAAAAPSPNAGRPRDPRPKTPNNYTAALAAIPILHRHNVCLDFYTTGRCNRRNCKYAEKHHCLFCESEEHGSAQCRA